MNVTLIPMASVNERSRGEWGASLESRRTGPTTRCGSVRHRTQGRVFVSLPCQGKMTPVTYEAIDEQH